MFNGTPFFEQISNTTLRITGLSLASDTAGTLGFATATGDPPDVVFPESFTVPSASFEDTPVALAALVKVEINPLSAGPLTNLPPSIEKTGTTGEDFRVTITNTNTTLTTQELEIYVTLLSEQEAGNIDVSIVESPNSTVTIKR